MSSGIRMRKQRLDFPPRGADVTSRIVATSGNFPFQGYYFSTQGSLALIQQDGSRALSLGSGQIDQCLGMKEVACLLPGPGLPGKRLAPLGNQRVQNSMCRLPAAVAMNFHVLGLAMLGPCMMGPCMRELPAADDHFFTLGSAPTAKKNAPCPLCS
jgi:hypothetical protein